MVLEIIRFSWGDRSLGCAISLWHFLGLHIIILCFSNIIELSSALYVEAPQGGPCSLAP